MADNSLSTTVEQRKARRRRSVHRYFTCTLLTLAADAAVNSYSLFATHWVTTCASTLWPMPPFSYDWGKPPPYLTSEAEGTGQGERDESPSSLPPLPALVPDDQHSLQLPAVAPLTKEAQGVWERGVWQAGLSVLRGRKGSQEFQRGETRENLFTGLREMREEMPELQSYRYVIGNSVLDLAIASYIRLVFLSLFAVRLLCASSLSDEGKEASHLSLPIFLQVLSLLLATVKAIARLIDFSIQPTAMQTRLFWAAMAATVLFGWAELSLVSRVRRAKLLQIKMEKRHAEWKAKQRSEMNGNGPKRQEAEDFDEEEEERKKAEEAARKRVSFRQLLAYCYPDKHLLAIAFVFLILAAVAQIFVPKFTGLIIDAVIKRPVMDEDELRKNTGYLVLSAAACALFTGVRGGIFSVTIARLKVRVSKKLFEALLTQEIGFFDTTKIGDITSRLNADTSRMSTQVGLNINVFLRSLVQAVGTLIFMFALSWQLTLLTFISLPIVMLISKYYGNFLRDLYMKVQEKLASANAVAEETLGSMHTVRFYASEDQEQKNYGQKLKEYYALQMQEALAYTFYASITTLLPNLVIAVVLFYGGRLVLADTISGGSLVTFLLYMSNLSSALNSIGDIYSSLSGALGAADKVFELINREPKMTPTGTMIPKATGSRIDIEDVTFRYPSRPGVVILKEFSLHINPGEVVALVGPSGGGKSSCVKLIENLYEPEAGRVMVDGRQVHEYDPKQLHRRLGIVGQEPVLYGRSIRRNIIYGLEGDPDEPTMEEVIAAAKLANAHAFITAMPDGYDTDVGEKGVQLSGGQKQRIAIARALVRKPNILLLDEATSALDAESEHLVQEAIDRLMHDCTVLVIAHRLSTVKSADRIVVVSGGKIVEEGKHRELVEKRGVYANMVKRQLQGASGDDEEETKSLGSDNGKSSSSQ